MVKNYLLEIKYEGKTVAFINEQGDFVCLDKEKMLRALRFDTVRIENLIGRLREFGITF